MSSQLRSNTFTRVDRNDLKCFLLEKLYQVFNVISRKRRKRIFKLLRDSASIREDGKDEFVGGSMEIPIEYLIDVSE